MSDSPVDKAAFKDRKVGLVVFGVIQLAMALSLLLMVPFMLISMATTSMNPEVAEMTGGVRMMLPAVFWYLLMAAGLATLGIGSIRARRWARALTLAICWLWLVGGVVAAVFMLIMMPEILGVSGAGQDMPSEFMVVIQIVLLVFMAVFYIIVPGAFIWFYGSRHVKATCEARQPKPSWTDNCPLPVLVPVVVCVASVCVMPLMGLYHWALPLFGKVVTGGVGAVVTILGAILLAVTGWGLYSLKRWAWWGFLVLMSAWFASTAVTMSREGMAGWYRAMDYPPALLKQMEAYTFLSNERMVMMMFVWGVAVVLYMLIIRRYFKAPPASSPVAESLSSGVASDQT